MNFVIDHWTLSVMNILIVFAWGAFSFLLWRGLRNGGVDEDRIFDLTFYATLMSLIAARVGFVVAHWEVFAGKSLLLIAAMWVSPGLSWLGALIGGLGVFIALSRSYKVRLGLVLDTLAVSLPLPIIIGEVASLISGSEKGTPTLLPWAIRVGSDTALRHPVQFYEMIMMAALSIIVYRLGRVAVRKKWPFGILGIWYFLLYAIFEFVLEFTKVTRVYWGHLSANQWVLIGIFAESLGVLYIRGGGRERMRPLGTRIARIFGNVRKGTYEFFSRRNTKGPQSSSA